MRTLIKLLLALAMLVAGGNALAVQVTETNVCQGTTVPTGWAIVNKTWSKTTCGNPTTPQGNVWQIARYDNLPVGTPLTICAFSSAYPSGWVPTSLQTNKLVCGAQYGNDDPYNTVTLKYSLCTSESTGLCYPKSGPFAVISALPSHVTIPYGQGSGSAELGWLASTSSACVWVTTAGSGTSQLWSCSGTYAVQNWPYVSSGVEQTFVVSPSATAPVPVLASVVVKGVEGSPPKIAASPTVVTVASGQTNGSTRISYHLGGSDYPAMCIWVSNNGAAAKLWACGTGTTFSQVWAFVPKGGTSTFWLNPSATSSSQILASVVVSGQ